MYKANLVYIILLLIINNRCYSQKKITTQDLIWYGYFNTIQFNDKYYLQSEIPERHFINPLAQHQFLFRTHFHRIAGNSGWETSLGMCTFFHNPNDPYSTSKFTTPELRPHLEFANKQKLNCVQIDHRYRAEARFFHNTNIQNTALENGVEFLNFRFRYRLQLSYRLKNINEKHALKVKISDEIHINAGKKIHRNIYDQNRFYVGLSLDVNTNFTIDIGYLNWFQQRANGEYFKRDILRFTFFHKLYLKNE